MPDGRSPDAVPDPCGALEVRLRAAYASARTHVHTLRALGATDSELSAVFSREVLQAARAHGH